MKNENALKNRTWYVVEQKELLEKAFEAWSANLITSEDYFTECLEICSKNIEVLEVW